MDNINNYYEIRQGQSLLDVSIWVYGTPVFAGELARINHCTIDAQLPAGTKVLLATAESNKVVRHILKENNSLPATGYSNMYDREGIGYWDIETDFIIY